MNQFVQRVANYVANEIIIKGLANSKTFQRFAVRTDASLKEAKAKGEKTVETAFSEFSTTTATTASGRPQPPQRGISGFVSAFFKEIGTDLGIVKRR